MRTAQAYRRPVLPPVGLVGLVAATVWLVSGGAGLDLAPPAFEGAPQGGAVGLLRAGMVRLTGAAAVGWVLPALYGGLWAGAALLASRAETGRPLLPALWLLPAACLPRDLCDAALGMPLFLLFSAHWRHIDGRRDLLVLGGTSLLLAMLALTQAAALVAACLVMAADGLERLPTLARRFGTAAAARRLLFDAAWAGFAAAPSLALVLGTEHAGAASVRGAGIWLVGEAPVAAASLLAILGLASLPTLRGSEAADALWPVFTALVLGSCALTAATGTTPLPGLLAPYAWGGLVLALAGRCGGAAGPVPPH